VLRENLFYITGTFKHIESNTKIIDQCTISSERVTRKVQALKSIHFLRPKEYTYQLHIINWAIQFFFSHR
jgi:hypothetical protein